MNRRELQEWHDASKWTELKESQHMWRRLAEERAMLIGVLQAERAAAWRRILDLSRDERLAAAMETIQTLRRKIAQKGIPED